LGLFRLSHNFTGSLPVFHLCFVLSIKIFILALQSIWNSQGPSGIGSASSDADSPQNLESDILRRPPNPSFSCASGHNFRMWHSRLSLKHERRSLHFENRSSAAVGSPRVAIQLVSGHRDCAGGGCLARPSDILFALVSISISLYRFYWNTWCRWMPDRPNNKNQTNAT
jgi:hypothetical protein